MKELISEEDLIKWKVNAATFNIEIEMLVRLKANQLHEEAMK